MKNRLKNLFRNSRANTLRSKYLYKDKKFKFSSIKKSKNADIAVLIHLYYPELWPIFASKIKQIPKNSYDLFVSIPKEKSYIKKTILSEFKDANIFTVPNRGRDVLPFIMIARNLSSAGYKKVLKIHSKKSTHRTDGNVWLNQMLESLLPNKPKVLEKVITTLDDPRVGVIGPEEQYISLPVNFDANSIHIQEIINHLIDAEASLKIDVKRGEYGFFAGTMFWARLDAIDDIFRVSQKISNYELEKGQIDGTYAHALERVFTLYPELTNRKIYEVSKEGVRELEYKTKNIPDWSNVLVKKKF
jgi:lipopolysaccharide biosynthesis protein